MASKESQVLDAAAPDDTQAQAIGTVVTVYGTAGVKTQGGELTLIEAGDSVYQNDVLATGEPGGLVVEFNDGSRLDLGRNSEATLDTEVYDAALVKEAAEDVISEADKIDSALEELDLDALAPTAAGNNGGSQGDEGNSFVLLDRSGQSTDPDSGYDTDLIEQVFGEIPAEESVLPVLAAGPAGPAAPVPEEPPCEEAYLIDQQEVPCIRIDDSYET